MIRVEVERQSDGKIRSFTMSGHAESGPYGYDLVCAGASAVSFGMVNAISELCQIDLDIEMKQNGGYLSCAVPEELEQDVSQQVQLLLEAMLVSLKTIEEQYSQFIEVQS